MNRRLALTVFFYLAMIFPAFLPAQNLKLNYSTYLGGDLGDWPYAIAVDTAGSMYITGVTGGFNDFPLVNAYQSVVWPLGTGTDAFVSKFAPDGKSLLYSTYLGGTAIDIGQAIAADTAGYAYVTGYTASTDFPVDGPLGSYQSSNAGWKDVFITQFGSTGSSLFYSTYLGGSDDDIGYGIAVDSGGSAYLTGSTGSVDFPTVASWQGSKNSSTTNKDIFVAKLSWSGYSLLFSDYLGVGSGSTINEFGYAITLDSSNDIYIAGKTDAGHPGNHDVLIRTFSIPPPPVYGTTLGGSDDDGAYGIAVDLNGNIYLAGFTSSTDFPVVGAYQSTFGGPAIYPLDAFVAKLYGPGGGFLSTAYATFLGGEGREAAQGLAIDSAGFAHIVGWTTSTDFPVANAYQWLYKGGYSFSCPSDAFVARLGPSGSVLAYSSFLGTSGDDGGDAGADPSMGIALDPLGRVCVTGHTNSYEFPISHPYRSWYAGGNSDAFVSRLSDRDPGHTDFKGDGISDIAVFRPGSGMWAVRNLTRIYFGGASDELAPGDYDGDGTTDVAVFRDSSGLWAVRNLTRAYLGSNGDAAVQGDYNGDGTDDIAICREGPGLWAVRNVTRFYFGSPGDMLVPGYYDGEGRMNGAVFRPGSGMWAVRDVTRVYFGASGDVPVPGDYNKDGWWEAGIFRDGAGLWAIRNYTRVYFGGAGDYARPANYNGDSQDNFGVFRDASGMWAVKDMTRVYFGAMGDLPVTR